MSSQFAEKAADSNGINLNGGEFDEPPLLEELEIYPERILENSFALWNPFQSSSINSSDNIFKEADVAGPIMFCLILAASLSIAKWKAQFSSIYLLSAISVVVMFCLIWLMCNSVEAHVTISAVASILGYSMVPIVGLSIVGVVVPLNNLYGTVFAGAAIHLVSSRSSRMFCFLTGDPHQRYLIAYPCALLYALFSLLVLF